MSTPSEAITFEQIEQAIHKADLSAFQAGGAHHVTAEIASANPRLALAAICSAYHAIEPLLLALGDVPLLSQRWKHAIAAFTDVMNVVCPVPSARA